MSATIKTANPLDADVPRTGRAADAYEVACTAIMLRGHAPEGARWLAPARHAVTLHRISGHLHRLAERQCNEDLTCPTCNGEAKCARCGEATCSDASSSFYGHVHRHGPTTHKYKPCPTCAGSGSTTGRREARLQRDAQAIAEHYGLRAYFQGDPRGCSLYLMDPASVPKSWAGVPGEPLEAYVYDSEAKNPPTLETLQHRWIAANYNHGHAVVRLG